MALGEFLVDKSALARRRKPAVGARLDPLADAGLLYACVMLELEVLFSARGRADYEQIRAELGGLRHVEMSEATFRRALDVQRQLARTGRHRAASLPDLLIAAAAEQAKLTVLHYDHDYDVIADLTGQPAEWVAPPGSAD